MRNYFQIRPLRISNWATYPEGTAGRAARAARAQPEPECLCRALGQVGEGGVPVQGDPLWRALPAASPERICRTLPCRAESTSPKLCACDEIFRRRARISEQSRN